MPKRITDIFSLSGNVAIVTGGAMGIGFGIAQRLAEAGAKVVIADIDEQVGEARAKQVNGLFVKTDVGSEADVQNLIKKVVETHGSLDILVNNAGIFPSMPTLQMSLEQWEKIQHVNLRGTFLCCREAAKVMQGKGGTIINIASIDALHPSQIGLAAYDASKHGVWGFTKSLALELGKQNIRVNAIAPGGINTEGVAKLGEQAAKAGVDMSKIMQAFMAKIPLGRMGEPDDIAMPVLFLASDASRYMTGEIVVVDGGALLA